MPFPDSEVPKNSEESAVKTEIGEMQTDREELAVDCFCICLVLCVLHCIRLNAFVGIVCML